MRLWGGKRRRSRGNDPRKETLMRTSLHKLDAYAIGRQFLIALDRALVDAP